MKRPSLVLVTVDCLRADHVGFGGCPRPVTPFLDSLAANSVVFSDAIVAGVPTYFSFPAIMASRYPLALGRDVSGIAPHEPTMATALRDAGYTTAAMLAGNPYLSARFGYDQGFDTFHDFLDSGLSDEAVPADHSPKNGLSNLNRLVQASSRRTDLTSAAYDEIYFWYCQWRSARKDLSMETLRRYPAADVIVDRACSWLSSLGEEPFFLWLHLMDPHHPYYPPEAALSSLSLSNITARRARFLNSFWNRFDVGAQRLQRYRSEIVSLYDAGVYWVDRQISRLLCALQELRRWDETVFAVTADHGEEFLEHRLRYHSPTSLPEQLIHVPLLLRAPGLSAANLSPGPFSLIHLPPTLLDAVGVPIPDSFQGVSCWDQICEGKLLRQPAITECVEACHNPFRLDDRMRPRLMAVRDHVYKLVINFREKSDYLYDLKNDPGEFAALPTSVLIGERARLLQVARAHFQGVSRNENAVPRLRARLRELQHSAGLTQPQPMESPTRRQARGPTTL